MEADYAIPNQSILATDGAGLVEGTPGMSLRDYFAGQALIGFLSYHGSPDLEQMPRDAKLLYSLADAMLAEREKKS